MNAQTAPSKTSHCEQYPGELFRGNMTRTQFDNLPYGVNDKRIGKVAFDEDCSIILNRDKLPSDRVYPVFVKRSAIEAQRRTMPGLRA